MKNYIIELCIEKQGNWNEICKALLNKEYHTPNENTLKQSGIIVVEKEYPERLKSTPRPPFCLFYRGNKDLLTSRNEKISFLDDYSRPDTQEGIYNREEILDNLPKNYICIAELKYGQHNKSLDRLKNLGRNEIIAICDCGIDLENPSVKYVIEHNGLVLSTTPESVKESNPETRTDSNVLLASLCDLLYVNELQSIGQETLMFALTNNHTCIATAPYSNFSSLRQNNILIKDGMEVVINVKDIENLLLKY